MKALKLLKRNGELISKEDAIMISHLSSHLFGILGISKGFLRDALDFALEPYWLITNAEDTFGHGTHGCWNCATGQWEYFHESQFETIEEIR